jgi:hypothetical protein
MAVVNSGAMSVFGLFYYATKIPTMDGFFSYGGLDESRFHGRDNFGSTVCTFFGVALACDLIFGTIFYPAHMDWLVAYFHHILYIYVSISKLTINRMYKMYMCMHS